MKKKSTWITLAIVIVVAAGLGFAWQANRTSSQSANSDNAKTSETKTIRIGTEGTYAPFSYFDKHNHLTGFDVDVARAVMKKAGYQVKFVDAPWDALLAAFNANKTDVLFNQVGITPERKAQFLFSTPYSYSYASLIVRKNNTTIKDFSDLKGKRAAQTLTSNYGKMAKKYGATIVSIDGFSKGVDLLTEGRADATLNDDVAYYDYLKQKPSAKGQLKIVKKTDQATPAAAMFHKNDRALVKKVDQALKDLKADGTLAKISKKYFGKDITKE